jgi:hypothetical protein
VPRSDDVFYKIYGLSNVSTHVEQTVELYFVAVTLSI